MEGKIILGKGSLEVEDGRAGTPPVVIREEPSHRSPGHLTGYRLPKEKRSRIEKNKRAEGLVRSVGA